MHACIAGSGCGTVNISTNVYVSLWHHICTPSPPPPHTQTLPVAPLYGDVQIKLPLLVKSLPHHDSSRWTCTSESLDEKVTFSVLDKMEQMRQEHVQIMSRLARYSNEVRGMGGRGRRGRAEEGRAVKTSD